MINIYIACAIFFCLGYFTACLMMMCREDDR